MQDKKETEKLRTSPSVALRVKQGPGQGRERMIRFAGTFLIGRHEDNDLQIKEDCVSRNHLEIKFDGKSWWVRDLGSTNGTYLNGVRIQNVLLPEKAELQLGKGGPVLFVEVEKSRDIEEVPVRKEGVPSETQIIRHYFSKSESPQIGEHTLMFRRAFSRVQKQQKKKYLVIVGLSLFLLVASGGVILYQKAKFLKLKGTAIDIFYSIKLLELQIAQLEDLVLAKGNKDQGRELLAKREHLKEMEKNYDHFIEELGLFKKMPEEERIILQMARLFGECEVNVPKDFLKEVRNYIKKWKKTDRLKEAIARAKMNNYTPTIIRALAENNLPPQFFYLPLQESSFEAHAVGPKTRYGHAKGIWQFIPITATYYDLKVGPLYKEAVYDPQDERFHFEKATQAAVRYLRDLNNTEAQASGLLVMAAYNWGETKIRGIIRRMPENPRERNFWCLLTKETIPQETYHYVFYIFSAAVICENPRLFGFDFDCPLS
jgi:membrane-bound lytic murein transglycosylase D